jgi:hypothetical protein
MEDLWLKSVNFGSYLGSVNRLEASFCLEIRPKWKLFG